MYRMFQENTEDFERLYSKTVQHLRSSHNNASMINPS